MRRIAIPAVLFAIWSLAIPVRARVPGARAANLAKAQPGQLGKVNFPTSCAPEVQATLEKGLALLHSFQYLESEQSFTDAAKQDPQCAMARWGKAMALYHQLWDFPQASTLKEGLEEIEQAQKSGSLTDRERGYLAAANRQDAKGVDTIGIPAREMLADMLFELKRPAEALAEYKIALKESPHRFDALYGAARSAQAAGNSAAAQFYYAKLAEISGPGADRPELAETKSSLARQSN